MGHLGLTPQSIHQLGGFRVQGRETQAVLNLKRDAKALQELGAFSVVLECVPSQVASEITQDLTIPTIGIGAGKETDGQVLVLQDLLGMNPSFKPKFVRHFLNGEEQLRNALKHYHAGVSDGTFPSTNESYT
jgi:3-methyl-2-oxobutanoate hydroxymethyltransferase